MATKPWFLSLACGCRDGMGEKGAGQRWFTNTVGSKAVDLELSLQVWRRQQGWKVEEGRVTFQAKMALEQRGFVGHASGAGLMGVQMSGAVLTV